MDLELWKKLKKEQKLTFDKLSELSNIPKRTLEDIIPPLPRTCQYFFENFLCFFINFWIEFKICT